MKYTHKKYWRFLIFLIISMTLISACNNSSKPQEALENGGAAVENTDSLFPITIVDSANRQVTIDKEPERIVSIQASNTEIAFALGLGDKIIGVSDYCNYPSETADIQKVGGQDINAEVVLSLLPDLALVTDYHYNSHPEVLQHFEEVGIDVLVVGSASSFQDTYDHIEMIGKATGKREEAKQLIAEMENKLALIKNKAEEEIKEKKRVWIEVSPAPDIFTTGKNTFMHEILESIKAINVAEDYEGWVKLTEEEIVSLNPDVIITTYGYYIENPIEDVLARDGWAEVPAVKNGEVYDVDNDIVSRPGPRLIEGVETLAKYIYPEVFAK